MRNARTVAAISIVSLTLPAALSGCDAEPARIQRVDPIVRDVPPALRGTIGGEVVINGVDPTLVSGYGVVVGLNGTGGQVLQERVAATVERQMALNGIGVGNTDAPQGIAGKSPRELLRDPNVCVVRVEALIPPGAPKGARFDVYVTALNASSLEGGRLWSTELRIGPASVFGSVQTRLIGAARGPVFVNPFADTGKEEAGVNETVGRVLLGGEVTEPLELELVMDQQSFSRARAIASAINSRFPEGRGDRGSTARGLSGGNVQAGSGGRIAVRVPSAFRDEPAEFLGILRGVQIDPSFPEEFARRYVAAIKAEPQLASELSYALEGLGPKAIPFLRELYEYGETIPQLAALRAGVGLEDARATPQLQELAKSGAPDVRLAAIRLLGRAKAGPTADLSLQSLLGERELSVRIAAYEALAARAQRAAYSRLLEAERSRTPGTDYATSRQLEDLAALYIPAGLLQGIERIPVLEYDRSRVKFLLDVVPFGEPLVYITQQAMPRIVIFGERSRLTKPLLVSALGDRFLMVADGPSDSARISYKPRGSDRAVGGTAPDTIDELIRYLASSPEGGVGVGGLAMTYSEVVSVLYAIFRDGATSATFSTERDRLLADLLTASQPGEKRERPETSKDTGDIYVFERPTPKDKGLGEPGWKPKVEPIAPKTPEKPN